MTTLEERMKKTQILVEEYANRYQMFEDAKVIVAGVSGGADSMCMLNILNQLKNKYGFLLKVVHVHHEIRGKEADEDMEYVENCCKEWNLEFYGYHYPVEEIAKQHHLSCEEAGRMVRYQAFSEVLLQSKGGKIAVAHNCDDNSETVLFHLFRGTGIKGLAGIVPVRENIIRPLLCLRRKQIEDYLKDCGIAYRTDITNKSDMYTRNKIRNHILPYVKEEINPKAAEHILGMSAHILEMEEYMKEQAEAAFYKIAEKKEFLCRMNCEKLSNYPLVIKKMVFREAFAYVAGKLKDITAQHIEDLISLSVGETGKQIHLPYNIIARKEYDTIIIAKEEKKVDSKDICIELNISDIEEGREYIVEITKNIKEKEYLVLKKLAAKNIKIQEKMYTKWLNYDILGSTCQFRNRKSGDYLMINHIGGRKKLKDYFIDIKLPRQERDTTWLLANGSEVFWVVGSRISESCKVTQDTKYILEISYVKEPQTECR